MADRGSMRPRVYIGKGENRPKPGRNRSSEIPGRIPVTEIFLSTLETAGRSAVRTPIHMAREQLIAEYPEEFAGVTGADAADIIARSPRLQRRFARLVKKAGG